MKLVDIIKYFENDESLAGFKEDYDSIIQTEDVLLYMENSLNIDSDIFFFSPEETDDLIVFEKDGIKYFALFSLDLGVEFYSYFEEMFESEKYTNRQKAARLLEYVINDV